MPKSPPVVVETVADCRRLVSEARRAGHAIGFVPTMGALHEGHLQLVHACRPESGFVVVSIFVNPSQFNEADDFQAYPRTLDDDLARCTEAGVDLIFAPTVVEMYPNGALSTVVEVSGLTAGLEGASRPGHFRGVTTVVAKLFGIVNADLAAFGLKDYQQLAVIRRMVRDLNMPVRILPVETVREADGLAMSSRNRRLSAEQRRASVVLSRALGRAAENVRSGERSADRVRQILREEINSEALARLDYAVVADAESLEPVSELDSERPSVALVAARFGSIRLIDNTLLPT